MARMLIIDDDIHLRKLVCFFSHNFLTIFN